MNKILMRSEQLLVSSVQRTQHFLKPNLIKGSDSLLAITQILLQKQIKSVMIVTTAGFVKRGTLDTFIRDLAVNNIKVTIFDGVKPDPDSKLVEQTAQRYRDSNSQAIVAIGGGSAMDTAKIAGALVVKPKQTVHQMTGTMKVRKRIPLLFAVPTTAGSGSEISPAAVINDQQAQRKYPITDLCIIPKYVILDPTLLLKLPSKMTAYSGMDALTHAIEGYINHFSPRYAQDNAQQAVQLIFGNLLESYRHGDNLEARENMLEAAFKAGIALSYGNTGYVHAISHGIGGLYHLPHGLINAVLLPKVLRAFQPNINNQLAVLAKGIGLHGENNEALANNFINEIELLRTALDIPNIIPEIAITDIPKLAQGAEKEGNPLYPVPDIWHQNQFAQIIEASRE